MIASRKERDSGADSVTRRHTGDPLPQVVFPLVICHDPGQEFKWPPSKVRFQEQAACHLSFVSLTPGPSWLLYPTIVGFSGRWYVRDQERWRSQTLKRDGTRPRDIKARLGVNKHSGFIWRRGWSDRRWSCLSARTAGRRGGRAVHSRTLHVSVHIKVPQAHPGQLRCGPKTK